MTSANSRGSTEERSVFHPAPRLTRIALSNEGKFTVKPDGDQRLVINTIEPTELSPAIRRTGAFRLQRSGACFARQHQFSLVPEVWSSALSPCASPGPSDGGPPPRVGGGSNTEVDHFGTKCGGKLYRIRSAATLIPSPDRRQPRKQSQIVIFQSNGPRVDGYGGDLGCTGRECDSIDQTSTR